MCLRSIGLSLSNSSDFFFSDKNNLSYCRIIAVDFHVYDSKCSGIIIFAKALRVSIAIVAVLAFYLPGFNNTKVANVALVGTTILTTVWYLLGDPFGINDTYIAIFTPLIVILCGRIFTAKTISKS